MGEGVFQDLIFFLREIESYVFISSPLILWWLKYLKNTIHCCYRLICSLTSYVEVLTSVAMDVTSFQNKGLLRYNQAEVIRVGPNIAWLASSKEKKGEIHRERPIEEEGRDCNDAPQTKEQQGLLAVTRNQEEKPWTCSPSQTPEKNNPVDFEPPVLCHCTLLLL